MPLDLFMRRGAPLIEAKGKLPVVADHIDVESGGTDTYDKHNKGGMALPTPPTSAGTGMEMAPLSSTPSSDSQEKNRVAHAYLTRHSSSNLKQYGAVLLITVICLSFLLPLDWRILMLVYAAVLFGCIASLWLARSVLQCDDGTAEMRQVSDPIREGAEGFLHVQYTVRLLSK